MTDVGITGGINHTSYYRKSNWCFNMWKIFF
jgi:hypothetical protein